MSRCPGCGSRAHHQDRLGEALELADAWPESVAAMADHVVSALHRWNNGVNQVLATEAGRRRECYREQARELVTLADTFVIRRYE